MGLFDSILSGISDMGKDKGCDWYCDNCDAHMNYQSGFTTYDDEWTCTNCGCVNDVSEDNIRLYNYDEDDDIYSDNVVDDDMPECCVACGGPYPLCITSCKIFDD